LESVAPPKEPVFTLGRILIAVLSGFFIGVLAGLVGLGGAEERIPFILYGLNFPLYDMIVANLFISLATSTFSFVLRTRAGFLPTSALYLSLAMIVGSLVGAYLGAVLSHRLPERRLKALIVLVLSLVVLRLAIDIAGGIPVPPAPFPAYIEYPLAAFFGVLIGIIAGSVGVAGGEYRIPVLLYVFGLGIKVAGTASQFVTLPTVMVALAKHRSKRIFSRQALVLSALMGIPSVAGVALSALLLVSAGEELIRLIFACILLYTIARLLLELRIRPSVSG